MTPRLLGLLGLAAIAPNLVAGDNPPCPDNLLLTCPGSYYDTHQPIDIDTRVNPEGGGHDCRLTRPDQRAVVMCTPHVEEPRHGYHLDCSYNSSYDSHTVTCTSWPQGTGIHTDWQLSGHQSVLINIGSGRMTATCIPGAGVQVSVNARTTLPNGIQHIENRIVACDAHGGGVVGQHSNPTWTGK